MNKTILVSVLLALTFSFLIFYAFHESFPPQKVSDIKDHPFFAENKNSALEKILLLGGSGGICRKGECVSRTGRGLDFG